MICFCRLCTSQHALHFDYSLTYVTISNAQPTAIAIKCDLGMAYFLYGCEHSFHRDHCIFFFKYRPYYLSSYSTNKKLSPKRFNTMQNLEI